MAHHKMDGLGTICAPQSFHSEQQHCSVHVQLISRDVRRTSSIRRDWRQAAVVNSVKAARQTNHAPTCQFVADPAAELQL
jgi:hypothetical protein